MAHDEEPEETARRLMRAGLSDEAIETRTGLPLMRLLAIRAGAAVEDRPAFQPVPPVSEIDDPKPRP